MAKLYDNRYPSNTSRVGVYLNVITAESNLINSQIDISMLYSGAFKQSGSSKGCRNYLFPIINICFIPIFMKKLLPAGWIILPVLLFPARETAATESANTSN
jgi:hypothetical protein